VVFGVEDTLLEFTLRKLLSMCTWRFIQTGTYSNRLDVVHVEGRELVVNRTFSVSGQMSLDVVILVDGECRRY
jgi:hypothetical protein